MRRSSFFVGILFAVVIGINGIVRFFTEEDQFSGLVLMALAFVVFDTTWIREHLEKRNSWRIDDET